MYPSLQLQNHMDLEFGQIGEWSSKFQKHPLGEAFSEIMLNFKFTKDFPVNWSQPATQSDSQPTMSSQFIREFLYKILVNMSEQAKQNK